MYLKKYKNKYKMLSIWSKFCLNQEAATHGKSITSHVHVLAFMIKNKGYLFCLLKISKAAHDKLSKSSPKHTFLRWTR